MRAVAASSPGGRAAQQQYPRWRVATRLRDCGETTASALRQRQCDAALLCSLLALPIWPLGAVAIILDFQALKHIPDAERGRVLPKWAIALGLLFLVLGIIGTASVVASHG